MNINDTKTFIPADFVELSFEKNVTDILLEKTCGLHQVLPLQSTASISDQCPAVSTDSKCISNKIGIEISGNNSLNPIIIPGGSEDEINNIRSKSGTVQVEVDARGKMNSININILLIFMAILFIQLN